MRKFGEFKETKHRPEPSRGEKCPKCGKNKVRKVLGEKNLYRCGFIGKWSGGCGKYLERQL